MQIEFRVGPQVLLDGSQQPPRMGRQGDVITGDGHSRYYETSYRASQGLGGLYAASTLAAGVAPGTVLSVTPPFTVYNPSTSGKNLVITRTSMGWISGTPGAGVLIYGVVIAQVAAPTGGTALTVQSCALGQASAGVGKAFSASTTVAIPSILRPAFTIGSGALTGQSIAIDDEPGGEFLVMPGSCFVMQAIAAAGTTPLAIFGAIWEEVNI